MRHNTAKYYHRNIFKKLKLLETLLTTTLINITFKFQIHNLVNFYTRKKFQQANCRETY